VAAVALEAPIPVVFGVLTTENRKQALERAREGGDNKGYEAAMAALQMIDLYRSLASN
jgi:6,7-dimethyl-8-ribityllumazine synthase